MADDRFRVLPRHGAVAGAVLALVVIVLLATPANVLAADRTIDFARLAPGTQLSNQYQSQGVSFGQSPSRPDQPNPLVVARSSTPPPSPGAQVAQQGCGVNDVCTNYQWLQFSPAVNHVSVQVTAQLLSATPSVTLTAYDGGDNQIATTTAFPQSNTFTPMSVSAPGGTASIAYVKITPLQGTLTASRWFAFTDLSYGPIVAFPSPDFGLVPAFRGDGVGVVAGGSIVGANITLRRYSDLGDHPITFTHSAPPTGVNVVVQPNPDSGGDFSDLTVWFTAAAGSRAGHYAVVITGVMDTSAGPVSHSITVPVTVETTYGLRVQGIEVTQGIQKFTLPARDPSNPAAPVSYNGVRLVAEGKPTVVRVFADAPNAPPGGVQGAEVQLSGTDSAGRPLPGSPVARDGGGYPNEGGTGGLIDSGSATVPASERNSARGSFDFTLPASWITAAATSADTNANPITLTAQLLPPTPSLFGPLPLATPCSDPACQALATFTLTGITSLFTGSLGIDPVALKVTGNSPDVYSAFTWANRVLPIDVFTNPQPGSIDITWVMQGCPAPRGGFPLCPTRDDKNTVALGMVEDFASNYNGGHGQAMAGVTSQDLGIENDNVVGTGSEPVAVVDSQRPLTDVTHEIGHMFGLVHAGEECGGGQDNDGDDGGSQNGEAWPPDGQGYIDGIGLDIPAGDAAGYPVVQGPGGSSRSIGTAAGQCAANQNPPECGIPSPQQFFDFMSYCEAADPKADYTLGSTNTWISVRNWDYIVTFSACLYEGGSAGDCLNQANGVKGNDAATAKAHLARAASLPRARTLLVGGERAIRVYGYSNPSGTAIAIVDPTPSRHSLSGLRSPFTVALQGRGGRIIARAPMVMQSVGVDGGGPGALLEGTLPQRAGATGVAILESGRVVAVRNKPAHKPRVKLLAPSGGQRHTATGPVAVRWLATDPDPVHLTVAIDFSADNGRTWRELESVTNSGRAAIPRAFFTRSNRARIRLRVSDGFDQVTVTSRRFKLTPAAAR